MEDTKHNKWIAWYTYKGKEISDNNNAIGFHRQMVI
jgi:hypothetical protein